MATYLSEYHEAKERFRRSNEKKRTEHEEIKYLDDVMLKLCRKSGTIDIGSDSTLFYKLIFHSDFIQIKEDVIKIFYSELCHNFLKKNIFEDIIENLECLELIPHSKTYLISGLLQSCRLEPVFNGNSLTFRNSREKIFHSLNLSNIHDIAIPNFVINKNLFAKPSFIIRCLKLLLRLGEFKELTLSGCSFNQKNIALFSEGPQIQTLRLSRCGSYENFLMERKFWGTLNKLTTLDISNNAIADATLEKIRCLPLKSLNISKCTHISDPTTAQLNEECEDKKIPNIDILWEEGILRETIKILDVSFNNLSQINLKKISELQLTQLDISSCLNANSLHISSVVFPNTLKILNSRYNTFELDDLKITKESPLEELVIETCDKELEFSTNIFHYLADRIKYVTVTSGGPHMGYWSILCSH